VRKKPFFWVVGFLSLASCSALREAPKYELTNGRYAFHQNGQRYQKAYVAVEQDTVRIFTPSGTPITTIKPSQDEFFRKGTLDVDVMTIGFKYRPIQPTLPQQLNTNFNGNLFLGYRVDRFQIHFEKTPAGEVKVQRHRAFTLGVFGGIGSTAVNPWTTDNRISDEYDGFIFSRGLAAMVGINNLTVGAAVGWDFLKGRDRNVWIYQNKPWIGLAVGLNLN
jgi:hypothetical protein